MIKTPKRMETELSRSFSCRLARFANWKNLKTSIFSLFKMQDLAAECLEMERGFQVR